MTFFFHDANLAMKMGVTKFSGTRCMNLPIHCTNPFSKTNCAGNGVSVFIKDMLTIQVNHPQ